jgi:nucleotide-binding universal stress UspA family protein
MKRVTVVTDMSELSQAAVPHGGDLARALRVPLRLIYVKNVWASVPMVIRLRLQAKQVRRDHLMEAVPAQLHGSLRAADRTGAGSCADRRPRLASDPTR